MKKRIWELDAFRGICGLGMVIVHLVYDLTELYALVDWDVPDWFAFTQRWGGVLFLLISGISATLGSRSVRRGIIVLCAGALVSAVTYGMYTFAGFDKSIIIYFGVLQCLGCCMILWWIFKRLPTWAMVVLGFCMVAAGLYLNTVVLLDQPLLMPLGFVYPGFASSDYFPLLPNLAYFLVGAVIGRRVYARRQTRFSKINVQNPAIRFLTFLGRHSLPVYLLHQPALVLLIALWQRIF